MAYGAVEGDVGRCVVEGANKRCFRLQLFTCLLLLGAWAILHYEGTVCPRAECPGGHLEGRGDNLHYYTCLARVTKMCGRLSRHACARSIDLCFSKEFCVTASSTHRQSTDFLIQACHTHCLTAALGLEIHLGRVVRRQPLPLKHHVHKRARLQQDLGM